MLNVKKVTTAEVYCRLLLINPPSCMKKIFVLLVAIGFSIESLQAQSKESIVQDYLEKTSSELGLTDGDIQEWSVTDRSYSRQSGLHYIYAQQSFQGIPIQSAIANFAITNDQVVYAGNRFVSNLSNRIQSTSPALSPIEAVNRAAQHLNIVFEEAVRIQQASSSISYVINAGDISREDIPVKLQYVSSTESILLAWEVSIYTLDGKNWWQLQIDAQNGKLIAKHDLIIHCNFDHSPFTKCDRIHDQEPSRAIAPSAFPITPAQYNVFALPLESPNHGSRTIEIDPSDTLASPFGWHDTDGIDGPEYTITRGNNVYAYEDTDDDDQPGFSPDGTASLNFDFPFVPGTSPTTYQAAAVTNLFYMNNMMHDIWYYYGFDEQWGNFQENNYGRGGQGGDYVNAEAQDGGGTNNANFATPPDGSNPRMQMYLWTGAGGNNGAYFLTVNSPTGIAGPYSATDATFGPGLPSSPGITADIVLLIDGNAPVTDGCSPATNTAALNGKIALIDRGICGFTDKVLAAQNAGAVAAIIANNTGGPPIQMGGFNSNITIPSIMISLADGNAIKLALAQGAVNATIADAASFNTDKDGDFDNGIIAHEYGHGISIRITGGPSNSSCLFSDEQMGEGWSDWFGLMLTIEPGDQGPDRRGIGTFAIDEPTTGNGIRPAPYTTNTAINSFTYGSTNNTGLVSQPHGLGFVFATALWDLTWALIDDYGGTPDPDVYNGTGGNNIAMQLVIEGLKLQPCNPGMIDGRDAILAADQALYNGAHQCLIWEVFADRGFGYSASQGSPFSRTDQVEAFDLPNSCLTPVTAPSAAFTLSSPTLCSLDYTFNDNSTDVPQSWFWDFGDGNTDSLENPTHTYAQTGTYTVKLVVSNSIGADSTTQQVTISLPSAPTSNDVDVCQGDDALLLASASGEVIWTDAQGNVIELGDSLVVQNVSSPQTYYLQNDIGGPSQNIGPVDNSIGGGNYHGTGFHGAQNFTAQQGLEIVSAWVDADGSGIRTFILASGSNGGTTPSGADIVDQVNVLLFDGPQRVDLNLTVPAAGDYSLGASPNANTAMYRNNSGANYPFSIPGRMTITSSSAGGANANNYYYYLYDLEVRGLECLSEKDSVMLTPVTSDFAIAVNGASISLTDNSIGATDWLWDFGDGNTSNLQNPTHTYASSGNYTITLSVNGGACSSSQTVDATIGIDDWSFANGLIKLVPNPSTDMTSLILTVPSEEDLSISIVNMNGQLVNEYSLREGATELNIKTSDWPKAVYFVRIEGETVQAVQKLIVQ